MRKILFIVTLVFLAVLIGTAVYAYRHQEQLEQDKQTAKPAAISNAPNVPTPGSLKFGIFTDTPNVQPDEQRLGAKLNILAWFAHWQDNLANNKLAYACQQGYVPIITWESWNGQQKLQKAYPLAAIAKGTYDKQIKQRLQAVASTCKGQTVIIRFDHEMDTPKGVVGWYPWQGDPVAYIDAWRHLVTISRSIDPNIKWLWSPNRGTPTAKLYYPGKQYVDYVGLTLNKGTLEPQEQSFAQFYSENQSVIESFGKPVLIGETTYDERTGDKAAWVTGMFAYAKQNKHIVGLVWFNGSADYSYDSSAATVAAFKKGLR